MEGQSLVVSSSPGQTEPTYVPPAVGLDQLRVVSHVGWYPRRDVRHLARSWTFGGMCHLGASYRYGKGTRIVTDDDDLIRGLDLFNLCAELDKVSCHGFWHHIVPGPTADRPGMRAVMGFRTLTLSLEPSRGSTIMFVATCPPPPQDSFSLSRHP